MIDSKATIVGGGTSPARAARLIWLIVLLGLITSGFTLVMVRGALASIAAQRARLAAATNQVDVISAHLDRSYVDAEDAMQRRLALRQMAEAFNPEFLAMGKMLDDFVASGAARDIGARTNDIESFIATLKSLNEQCASWGRRYLDCQSALEDRKRSVERWLLAMASTLGRVEGHQRLELALKVRKFRRQTGEAAGDLARQIVEGMQPDSDVNDLRTELSTLAMLMERIAGEDGPDRLADLKDNEIAASLFRLRPILARFDAAHPELRQDIHATLGAFQRAVLGEEYEFDQEHQTITPGDGGLYAECRQRLELRQQREVLREKMARWGEQYRAVSNMLDAVQKAIKDNAASETERMLVRQWRTLFCICLMCAATLLGLGNVISRTLRRQIATVERATAELRDSEARTRTIVDTALDAVVTMDHLGHVVGWNPQATATFGYTRDQAVGRDLAELIVPPAHQAAHRAALRRFLETGEGNRLNRRVEVAAVHRDGSQIPVELAVSPLRSGGKVHFGAFLRDLTAMKRAEAEREELHDRLLKASRQAGMAEVATGVLHNVGNALNSVNVSTSVVTERLRQSEVTNLQRAGDMLRENLADLSRYLTSDERGQHLPGFLIEVAQCLGEDQKAMLQEMEAVGRGLDHIKHIVGSQQTHAKRGVMLQPVRPLELIETALEMNRESFKRHDIAIDRGESRDLPAFALDKHKVLQVLVNVITNAKNAVCEGRPSERRIAVSACEAQGESGRVVRFEVADNGMGIAPENLARIFAHGFTTRAQGHGFGLHSAANAAREMGGNLTAASEGPGRGATFRLDLPAVEPRTPERDSSKPEMLTQKAS